MNAHHHILIYCGDLIGLGHLRRNTAIAARLVQDLPGSNAMLLTSLPNSNVFECPPGVDVVKLPSLSKNDRGEIGARTLSVRQTQLKRVRAMMIEGLAQSFRPDLLLVDHLPVGVWGELRPLLERMAREPHRPSAVLGLRDILDDPARTRRRWLDTGVYRAIERNYDAVLVYGSQDVFDSSHHYGLPAGAGLQVEHCGYLCSEGQLVRQRPDRRDLGLDDRPLVVITAGGGADGYPMMRRALEASAQLRTERDLQVVCITGPLMDRAEVTDLRARAADVPASVLWCVDRAPAYLQCADLVVTMAGYNTLIEAVRLRKKTVVLPRSGPSAEQVMRTRLFAARGLVHTPPAGASTEDLAGLLRRALDADAPVGDLPQMDGLDRVAARLRSLLEARAARRDLPAAEEGR